MLRQTNKAAFTLPFGEAPRQMEMEVVFGTPSKNCDGAGVCMLMHRLPKIPDIRCPHAPAIIHCSPGRELIFRFRETDLDGVEVQTYFKQDFFLVEEAFRLPPSLVRKWNIPVRFIQPGRYPLIKFYREWRLYFSY